MKNIICNLWIYYFFSNICLPNVLIQTIDCKKLNPIHYYIFNDENGFNRFCCVPIQDNEQQNIDRPFQTKIEQCFKSRNCRDIWSPNGVASYYYSEYKRKYYCVPFKNGYVPGHQNFCGDILRKWYTLPNCLDQEAVRERCHQRNFVVPYYNCHGPLLICKRCGCAYVPYSNNYFFSQYQRKIQHIKIHGIPICILGKAQNNAYDLKETFNLDICVLTLIPNYLTVVLTVHKEISNAYVKECFEVSQPRLVNIPLFSNVNFESVGADFSPDTDLIRTVKHLLYLFGCQAKPSLMPCYPGTEWHTASTLAPVSFHQPFDILSPKYTNPLGTSFSQKNLPNNFKTTLSGFTQPEITDTSSFINPEVILLQGKSGLSYFKPTFLNSNHQRYIPKLGNLSKSSKSFSLNREGVPWSPARSFLKPNVCRPEDGPQRLFIESSPLKTLGDLSLDVRSRWPLQYASIFKESVTGSILPKYNSPYMKVGPDESNTSFRPENKFYAKPLKNRVSLTKFSCQPLSPELSKLLQPITKGDRAIRLGFPVLGPDIAQPLSYFPSEPQLEFDILSRGPRYISRISPYPSALLKGEAEGLVVPMLPIQNKPLTWEFANSLPINRGYAGGQILGLSNIEILKSLYHQPVTTLSPLIEQFATPNVAQGNMTHTEATPSSVFLPCSTIAPKLFKQTGKIGPELSPKLQNGLWSPVTESLHPTLETMSDKFSTRHASVVQPQALMALPFEPFESFPQKDSQINPQPLGLPMVETRPLTQPASGTQFGSFRPDPQYHPMKAEQTTLLKASRIFIPTYEPQQVSGATFLQFKPPGTLGSMITQNQPIQNLTPDSFVIPWRTQEITAEQTSPLSPLMENKGQVTTLHPRSKFLGALLTPSYLHWKKIKTSGTPMMFDFPKAQIITPEAEITSLGPCVEFQPRALKAQTELLWQHQHPSKTPLMSCKATVQHNALYRAIILEAQETPNTSLSPSKFYKTPNSPKLSMAPAVEATRYWQHICSEGDTIQFTPFISKSNDLDTQKMLSKIYDPFMTPRNQDQILWPFKIPGTYIAPIRSWEVNNLDGQLIIQPENSIPGVTTASTYTQHETAMDSKWRLKLNEASYAEINPMKHHQKMQSISSLESMTTPITSLTAFTKKPRWPKPSTLTHKASKLEMLPQMKYSTDKPVSPGASLLPMETNSQLLNLKWVPNIKLYKDPTQEFSKDHVTRLWPCDQFKPEIIITKTPNEIGQKGPGVKLGLLTSRNVIQTLDSAVKMPCTPRKPEIIMSQIAPLTSNRFPRDSVMNVESHNTHMALTSLLKPCTKNSGNLVKISPLLLPEVSGSLYTPQKPYETPLAPVTYVVPINQEKPSQPCLAQKSEFFDTLITPSRPILPLGSELSRAQITLPLSPKASAAQMRVKLYHPSTGLISPLQQPLNFETSVSPIPSFIPYKVTGAQIKPLEPYGTQTGKISPSPPCLLPKITESHISPLRSSDAIAGKIIPLRPNEAPTGKLTPIHTRSLQRPEASDSHKMQLISSLVTKDSPLRSKLRLKASTAQITPLKSIKALNGLSLLPKVSASELPLSRTQTASTYESLKPSQSLGGMLLGPYLRQKPQVLTSQTMTLKSPKVLEAQTTQLKQYETSEIKLAPLSQNTEVKPQTFTEVLRADKTETWPCYSLKSDITSSQITTLRLSEASSAHMSKFKPYTFQARHMLLLEPLPSQISASEKRLLNKTAEQKSKITLVKPYVASKGQKSLLRQHLLPEICTSQITSLNPPTTTTAPIKPVKLYRAQPRLKLPWRSNLLITPSSSYIIPLKSTVASRVEVTQLKPSLTPEAEIFNVQNTQLSSTIVSSAQIISAKPNKNTVYQKTPSGKAAYGQLKPIISNGTPMEKMSLLPSHFLPEITASEGSLGSSAAPVVPLTPFKPFGAQTEQILQPLASEFSISSFSTPKAQITNPNIRPLKPNRVLMEEMYPLPPCFVREISASEITPLGSPVAATTAQLTRLKPCIAKTGQISLLPEITLSNVTPSILPETIAAQIKPLKTFRAQTEQRSIWPPHFLPEISVSKVSPLRSAIAVAAQKTSFKNNEATGIQRQPFQPSLLPEITASEITSQKPPKTLAARIITLRPYEGRRTQTESLWPCSADKFDVLKPHKIQLESSEVPAAQIFPFKSNAATVIQITPIKPYLSHGNPEDFHVHLSKQTENPQSKSHEPLETQITVSRQQPTANSIVHRAPLASSIVEMSALRPQNDPGTHRSMPYTQSWPMTTNGEMTEITPLSSAEGSKIQVIPYRPMTAGMRLKPQNGPSTRKSMPYSQAWPITSNGEMAPIISSEDSKIQFIPSRPKTAGIWLRSQNGPRTHTSMPYTPSWPMISNGEMTPLSSTEGSTFQNIPYRPKTAGIWLKPQNGPSTHNNMPYTLSLPLTSNGDMTPLSSSEGSKIQVITLWPMTAGIQLRPQNGPRTHRSMPYTQARPMKSNGEMTALSSSEGSKIQVIPYRSDTAGIQFRPRTHRSMPYTQAWPMTSNEEMTRLSSSESSIIQVLPYRLGPQNDSRTHRSMPYTQSCLMTSNREMTPLSCAEGSKIQLIPYRPKTAGIWLRPLNDPRTQKSMPYNQSLPLTSNGEMTPLSSAEGSKIQVIPYWPKTAGIQLRPQNGLNTRKNMPYTQSLPMTSNGEMTLLRSSESSKIQAIPYRSKTGDWELQEDARSQIISLRPHKAAGVLIKPILSTTRWPPKSHVAKSQIIPLTTTPSPSFSTLEPNNVIFSKLPLQLPEKSFRLNPQSKCSEYPDLKMPVKASFITIPDIISSDSIFINPYKPNSQSILASKPLFTTLESDNSFNTFSPVSSNEKVTKSSERSFKEFSVLAAPGTVSPVNRYSPISLQTSKVTTSLGRSLNAFSVMSPVSLDKRYVPLYLQTSYRKSSPSSVMPDNLYKQASSIKIFRPLSSLLPSSQISPDIVTSLGINNNSSGLVLGKNSLPRLPFINNSPGLYTVSEASGSSKVNYNSPLSSPKIDSLATIHTPFSHSLYGMKSQPIATSLDTPSTTNSPLITLRKPIPSKFKSYEPVMTYSNPPTDPGKRILPKPTTAPDLSINPTTSFSVMSPLTPVTPTMKYKPFALQSPYSIQSPANAGSLDTPINTFGRYLQIKSKALLSLQKPVSNISPEVMTSPKLSLDSSNRFSTSLSEQVSPNLILSQSSARLPYGESLDITTLEMPANAFGTVSPVSRYSPCSLPYSKLSLNSVLDSPVNSLSFVSPPCLPFDLSHQVSQDLQLLPLAPRSQCELPLATTLPDKRSSSRFFKPPSYLCKAPVVFGGSENIDNIQSNGEKSALSKTPYLLTYVKPKYSNLQSIQKPAICNEPPLNKLRNRNAPKTRLNYLEPRLSHRFNGYNRPTLQALNKNEAIQIWNAPQQYQNEKIISAPCPDDKTLKTPYQKEYLDENLRNILLENVLHYNIPISVPLNEIFAYPIGRETYYISVPTHLNGIYLYICKGHTKIIKPKIVFEVEDVPTTYYEVKCPPDSLYSKPLMRSYVLEYAKSFIQHKYNTCPALINDLREIGDRRRWLFLNGQGVKESLDVDGNFNFLSKQINHNNIL